MNCTNGVNSTHSPFSSKKEVQVGFLPLYTLPTPVWSLIVCFGRLQKSDTVVGRCQGRGFQTLSYIMSQECWGPAQNSSFWLHSNWIKFFPADILACHSGKNTFAMHNVLPVPRPWLCWEWFTARAYLYGIYMFIYKHFTLVLLIHLIQYLLIPLDYTHVLEH